jgi:hypothetical protein
LLASMNVGKNLINLKRSILRWKNIHFQNNTFKNLLFIYAINSMLQSTILPTNTNVAYDRILLFCDIM